jgi:hypothetical protein
MDAPSPPAAPDPAATAAAQATANKETAITQYGLNATNQYTPQGSLEYTQNGTWADGTPRFNATQSYSPGEQKVYDSGLATRQNLGDIGQTQSAKIGELLNTPYNLNEATQNKISGIQKSFLDPQWQEEGQRLESQLINKGIRPGSAAYDNAMRDFSTNKQRAYNQSYLDAYKTAESSSMAERNQPINEITALMSGSQVSQPGYTNTPQPGVAPTDVIGAQQQSLNQQNLGYQSQLNNNQGLMSGLFGLGKTAMGGWMMSDIDTKENIEVIGERGDGLHVIDFDYKPEFGLDDERHRGLIAQEVAQVYPDAVGRVPSKGNKMAVDYSRVPDGGLFALGASYGR